MGVKSVDTEGQGRILVVIVGEELGGVGAAWGLAFSC